MAERTGVFAFVKFYTWDNGRPSVLPERRSRFRTCPWDAGGWTARRTCPQSAGGSAFSPGTRTHLFLRRRGGGIRTASDIRGSTVSPPPQSLSGGGSLHQNQGDEEGRGGRLPGDGGQDTYRGKALLPPGRFGGQVRNRVHKATHRRLLTPGPKIVEGQ